MFERILVPIDIQEPDVAKESLAATLALAKAFKSQIRLIHVASPIVPGSPMAAIPPSVYEDIGVYEKAQIEEMAKALDRPRETVTTLVRIGGVYPEILAEAEEWPADLIVVGAHRRSMATFLLGSTAAALSRHAKCTVMIVRSPLKATII